MPEKMKSTNIEEFLDALSRKKNRSRGEKAAISTVIRNHKEELKEYIKSKKKRGSAGGIKLARYYQELLEEYEEPVKGLHYIETIASLRTSFHVSKKNSLTFKTENKWGKIVGYALAATLFGFTLWAGYQAKLYIEDMFRQRTQNYNRTIDNMNLEKRLAKDK